MSTASRFLGVVFSPALTFADIVRRPDFLAPLITVVVAAVVAAEVVLWKVGMEQIIRISLEQSRRSAQMSAEQIEQAVQQGVRFGYVFAHVGAVLGEPVILLIVAGLGLAIINGIFGGQLNFKTAFSVACYAGLVSVLPALMTMVIVLFGNLEEFNPQTPVPTNIGFFLNPMETSPALYALARSADLFTFWFLALVSMGLSEAASRKVKTILFVYLGLWVVWTLAKMGFAMLAG